MTLIVFFARASKARKRLSLSVSVRQLQPQDETKSNHKTFKRFHPCALRSCEKEECERAFKTVTLLAAGGARAVPSVPYLDLRHFVTCHI